MDEATAAAMGGRRCLGDLLLRLDMNAAREHYPRSYDDNKVWWAEVMNHA